MSNPLTAEEEAALRAALAGPYRDDRWSGDHVARLLATLDAARSTTPSSETWCPTHHKYDHCEDATLAALATPDNAGRSPIDVDVLARAMHGGPNEPWDDGCLGLYDERRHAEWVRARLSESTGSEEPR